MTVKEFTVLADAIKTFYPKDNILATEKAMQLWYEMLKDLDYQAASVGLKKHIATSPYPPTVADIRAGASDITTPQALNEQQAWSLVKKAISDSTYNSVKHFSELPKVIQRAVGSPNQLRTWAMDEEFNEYVVSSNFMRAYKIELQREKDIAKIPQQIKDLVEKVNENSDRAMLDKKNSDMIVSQGVEVKMLDTDDKPKMMPDDVKAKFEEMRSKYKK